MTNHERFVRTMTFQPVDHPPLVLDGGWRRTHERWCAEGLPEGVSLYEYFDVEPFRLVNVSPETRLFPRFTPQVLSEDELYVEWVDHNGVRCRRRQGDFEDEGTLYVEYPIRGPADQLWLDERLDPADPGRRANGWDRRLGDLDSASDLALIDFGSFYGDLHEHMGTDAMSLALYDHPDFVHWYNDRIAACCEAAFDAVLPDARVTCMGGHEDMCFKNGPLISPGMFREFLMPYYRRTVQGARRRGQSLFLQDCDGDVRALLPLWLEAGVNAMSPLEVAAGLDVCELRREYGRDLLMMGGIDKRALATGKEEIRREVLGKRSVVEEGGYVPKVDHGVPPDVSWGNYCYYVELLKGLYGM